MVDFCNINANTPTDFMRSVLELLCSMATNESVEDVLPINMTTTDPAVKQQVVAAPGVGKKIVIRSLFANTEVANTVFRFFSTNATGPVHTPASPQFEFLNNAGVSLAQNSDGWIHGLENESITIDSDNSVDLLGSYKIVPV